MRAGSEIEEIRNQVDSGGSTTAGRNGAPRVARLCSGVASGRASICSRQRSPAPAAGAKSRPACPYQAFHRQHTTTVTAGLKPCSQHCLGEKDFQRTSSVPLPGKEGSRDLGAGPQPLLSGSFFFFFRKLFLSIASLATVSAPASAPSFLHSGTSPGSIFPIPPSLCWNPALARQSHTKPPPSRTPSTFCLNFQELSLHTNL